jgi:hypothetical protein
MLTHVPDAELTIAAIVIISGVIRALTRLLLGYVQIRALNRLVGKAMETSKKPDHVATIFGYLIARISMHHQPARRIAWLGRLHHTYTSVESRPARPAGSMPRRRS